MADRYCLGCRGGTGGRVPEIREEARDEYAQAVARVGCQYHRRHKYLLSLSPLVTITALSVYHYHRFSCLSLVTITALSVYLFSLSPLVTIIACHYHRRHKYLCMCARMWVRGRAYAGPSCVCLCECEGRGRQTWYAKATWTLAHTHRHILKDTKTGKAGLEWRALGYIGSWRIELSISCPQTLSNTTSTCVMYTYIYKYICVCLFVCDSVCVCVRERESACVCECARMCV